MKISDLNIYILGDSISFIPGAWSYSLAKQINCKSVHVLASGGAKWGYGKSFSSYIEGCVIWDNPFHPISFDEKTIGFPGNRDGSYNNPIDISIINSIINQERFMDRVVYEFKHPYPNVIIISCGINDTDDTMLTYSEDVFQSIVSKNTFTKEEKKSLCYGVKEALDKLKEEYPKSKVILISPIPMGDDRITEYIYNTAKWLKAYAEYYGYAYIEGFISEIYNHPNRKGLFSDGLHPNDVGFEVVSKYLSKEITKILTE